MSGDVSPSGSVRFARRQVGSPGSIAELVEQGHNPAGLFSVVANSSSDTAAPPSHPARLTSGAFVAASEAAERKLDSILDGHGQFVSTGQQPGLFLGPLYTIYKLASSINLARRLEEATGVPHLPLFWVASDDHDWDEVASCSVLAPDESITCLDLAAVPTESRDSVGEAELPPDIANLVDTLESVLDVEVPVADDSFLAALRSAYRPGQTVSGAFIRLVTQVFPGVDFVLLDSAHPAVRGKASELYERIVRDPSSVITAVQEGKDAVEEAGYRLQLTPPPEGVQIFLNTGDGRQHILASATGFGTSAGDSYSEEELLELLKASPQSFTPAAALRPVLESWLLPVHATVLGPGEVAYWAQLYPLFEALQVGMPTVTLRDGWFLIEPRVERLLKKIGADPSAVESNQAGLREAVVAKARPDAVDRSLDELVTEVALRLDSVVEAGAEELPGLSATVSKSRKAVLAVIADLKRAIDTHAEGRQETALKQIDRLGANLAPGGGPQERALGSVGFLARYGPELVRGLLHDDRVAGTQGQD